MTLSFVSFCMYWSVCRLTIGITWFLFIGVIYCNTLA
jgi:hypothetical protein